MQRSFCEVIGRRSSQVVAPDITAVVPTLNEEISLPRTMSRLVEGGFEIVVVDGGSKDRTVELARRYTSLVFVSPPGRGPQMNLGAAQGRGEILFFVHADSLPPRQAPDQIRRALDRPRTIAGAFRLRIDSRDIKLRIISALANLRSYMGLPYGDQGLFLYRRTFRDIGGFKEIPLMEDVDLVRRLRKKGRIAIADGSMLTSARRWYHRGIVTNSLNNLRRVCRYYRGASPEELAREYKDVR